MQRGEHHFAVPMACIADLHEMLKKHEGWIDLGLADLTHEAKNNKMKAK